MAWQIHAGKMDDASVPSLVLGVLTWAALRWLCRGSDFYRGVPVAPRPAEQARLGEGVGGASHKLAIPYILRSHIGCDCGLAM